MPAGPIDAKERPRLDMPPSMPSANGAVGGPWSSVPLWRGLDSAFLCEPNIPKPPLTPRIYIDEFIPIPRLPDNPFLGSTNPTRRAVNEVDAKRTRSANGLPPIRLLLLSAALGFVGGMIMAWCSGLFG